MKYATNLITALDFGWPFRTASARFRAWVLHVIDAADDRRCPDFGDEDA